MNAPGGQSLQRDIYDGARGRWSDGANVKRWMCDGK